MNKLVIDGMITDLHIHSVHSKHKDQGKDYIKANTAENIQVLVKKLNDNNVNICAISDHDVFSFSIYKALKNEEGKGTIKKVLPAVEFSVMIKRGKKTKPIHVVTVFDDQDEEKVKNIESVLKLVNERPQYDSGDSFTENKFIELLSEIGLNTLCIAHQKSSLMTEGKPYKNDVSTLGRDTFNEFLFAEYFEAFEFKNRRNEIFNNITKSKMQDDLLRFVTGSDCHDWTVYPKYDSNEKDGSFKFTYLKCLPTFRGVSLAITEDSRISLHNNFFNQSDKIIDTIDLVIDEKEVSIPLSRGINAIIGDNSIGKSLLLHKLTDYYRENIKKTLSPLNNKIVKGYESYLSDNKVDINTKINQSDIFEFDTQGEIRRKFNLKLLKEDDFFKDKYPTDVNTVEIESYFNSKIDTFIKMLNNRFKNEAQLNNIGNIKIIDIPEAASSLTFKQSDFVDFKNEKKKYEKIINKLMELKIKYNELIILIENKEERTILNNSLSEIIKLENKYIQFKELADKQIKMVNILNTVLTEYEENYSEIKTKQDQVIESFLNSRDNIAKNLALAVKTNNDLIEYDYKIDEKSLKPNTENFLNYIFVKKNKVTLFDNEYFIKLLKSPLKANYTIDFDTMDKAKLTEVLKQFEQGDPSQFYKEKLKEQLKDDLSSVESIIEKSDDTEKVYSDGLNVKIYFNIISSMKNNNGVYLIDQPEDDVSPRSIKEHILTDFKRMSRFRQVILVTHNPQFVVNLDVDNVIHISKNEGGNILIKSGALEYEGPDYKILEVVAHSLEGGVETIRKRWKKYEKNIYNKS